MLTNDSIKFWDEIVADKDSKIIVDGKCYTDGGYVEHPAWYQTLGFDGQRHTIIFNDGRKVVTNNLWLNGDVPSEYKEVLKDNAKFVWNRIM